MRYCCIPSSTVTETLYDQFDRLEDTKEALDMRCRCAWYECKEYLIRAKRFKCEDNQIECLAQLRMRHTRMEQYQLLVKLRDRVEQTIQSIDQAQVVTGVAVQMESANHMLKGMCLNVDQIDELMNDLDDNTRQVAEIAGILGNDTMVAFDEAAALLELEQEEEELPSVPMTPVKRIEEGGFMGERSSLASL
jgi:predicted XRE-type DNA-binding protein